MIFVSRLRKHQRAQNEVAYLWTIAVLCITMHVLLTRLAYDKSTVRDLAGEISRVEMLFTMNGKCCRGMGKFSTYLTSSVNVADTIQCHH